MDIKKYILEHCKNLLSILKLDTKGFKQLVSLYRTLSIIKYAKQNLTGDINNIRKRTSLSYFKHLIFVENANVRFIVPTCSQTGVNLIK